MHFIHFVIKSQFAYKFYPTKLQLNYTYVEAHETTLHVFNVIMLQKY